MTCDDKYLDLRVREKRRLDELKLDAAFYATFRPTEQEKCAFQKLSKIDLIRARLVVQNAREGQP